MILLGIVGHSFETDAKERLAGVEQVPGATSSSVDSAI
jgi:hypothetical protein